MAQSMYTEAAAGECRPSTRRVAVEGGPAVSREAAGGEGQLVRRLVALLNHGHRIVVNKHRRRRRCSDTWR